MEMVIPKNPNAIHILENNLDKVDWTWLSLNPNANNIIENNLEIKLIGIIYHKILMLFIFLKKKKI